LCSCEEAGGQASGQGDYWESRCREAKEGTGGLVGRDFGGEVHAKREIRWIKNAWRANKRGFQQGKEAKDQGSLGTVPTKR